MRIPVSKRAIVRTRSIPAPVGGLNARDAIADMRETDAVTLENWYPTEASLSLRNGSANWVTGFATPVESLLVYSNAVLRKMFAASGTAFYDATNSGVVGAPVQTGLTNARWESVNFGTPGGRFMYCVNGVDSPRLYDGTTWTTITGASTPAITGVTTSNLMDVAVFKNRLWFIERNTFKIWYLPTSSIGGVAQSIDFSSLFKMGGYLYKMITWTRTDSLGTDDYAVFISSEGELALYRGTDPANAATWALNGLGRIGRPISKRGFTRFGNDVVCICADGFFLLSQAFLGDRSGEVRALSDKIVGLASADIQTYSNTFGWDVVLSPLGKKMLFNVPSVGPAGAYQYVMNTQTKAWTKFTGWPANCFALLGDQLMYGGANAVVEFDTGQSDNGAAIFCDAQPAFSYFTTKQNKRFTLVRPILQSDGAINALIDMSYDFATVNPMSAPNLSSSPSSLWNVSDWNVTSWSFGTTVKRDWQSVNGIGFAASLRFQILSLNQSITWQASDYVFENGGIL